MRKHLVELLSGFLRGVVIMAPIVLIITIIDSAYMGRWHSALGFALALFGYRLEVKMLRDSLAEARAGKEQVRPSGAVGSASAQPDREPGI